MLQWRDSTRYRHFTRLIGVCVHASIVETNYNTDLVYERLQLIISFKLIEVTWANNVIDIEVNLCPSDKATLRAGVCLFGGGFLRMTAINYERGRCGHVGVVLLFSFVRTMRCMWLYLKKEKTFGLIFYQLFTSLPWVLLA